MKIRFTNKYGCWGHARSGKGKFARRIIAEWEKLGHEVLTDTDTKVDVDLQMQRFNYKPKHARCVVIRSGPVEYDINVEYKAKNAAMAEAQMASDGVIYQSAFAEKAQRAMVWNCNRPTKVIRNGADPDFYSSLEPWPSPFKVNFLASTREWVWEKRLMDILAAFRTAAIPDSCLWILGQTWEAPKRFPPFQKGIEKRENAENIRFMGPQDDVTIGRFLRMATCLLHAVYIDACPNALAEAACAGCPVIATNVGGQTEIADHVLNIDPPWNFRPRNRREPPALNLEAFADAMRHPPQYDGRRVEIADVAVQYLQFFQELLA